MSIMYTYYVIITNIYFSMTINNARSFTVLYDYKHIAFERDVTQFPPISANDDPLITL